MAEKFPGGIPLRKLRLFHGRRHVVAAPVPVSDAFLKQNRRARWPGGFARLVAALPAEG
jgi:hypothetical protein